MPIKFMDGVAVELTQAEIDEITLSPEQIAAIQAQQDARRIERIKQEFDRQDSVNKVLLKIGFLQENRIRVLEGRPEVTADQFRSWVEGQID